MSVGANSEVKSSSSELSGADDKVETSYTSQDVDDILAADSDSCNTTDSFTTESPGNESAGESSTVDVSESLSESNDNEAAELDMSFTETDNANTCLDDVTAPRVTTTTADGPTTSAINTIDIKLAAAADNIEGDNDDHRHFVGSDRPCSDIKHDTQSIMVSHVAMDIN